MFVFCFGTFLLLAQVWFIFVKIVAVTFENGRVFQSTAAISSPRISKIFGRLNEPNDMVLKGMPIWRKQPAILKILKLINWWRRKVKCHWSNALSHVGTKSPQDTSLSAVSLWMVDTKMIATPETTLTSFAQNPRWFVREETFVPHEKAIQSNYGTCCFSVCNEGFGLQGYPKLYIVLIYLSCDKCFYVYIFVFSTDWK